MSCIFTRGVEIGWISCDVSVRELWLKNQDCSQWWWLSLDKKKDMLAIHLCVLALGLWFIGLGQSCAIGSLNLSIPFYWCARGTIVEFKWNITIILCSSNHGYEISTCSLHLQFFFFSEIYRSCKSCNKTKSTFHDAFKNRWSKIRGRWCSRECGRALLHVVSSQW